jgi:hypothetical protein
MSDESWAKTIHSFDPTDGLVHNANVCPDEPRHARVRCCLEQLVEYAIATEDALTCMACLALPEGIGWYSYQTVGRASFNPEALKHFNFVFDEKEEPPE